MFGCVKIEFYIKYSLLHHFSLVPLLYHCLKYSALSLSFCELPRNEREINNNGRSDNIINIIVPSLAHPSLKLLMPPALKIIPPALKYPKNAVLGIMDREKIIKAICYGIFCGWWLFVCSSHSTNQIFLKIPSTHSKSIRLSEDKVKESFAVYSYSSVSIYTFPGREWEFGYSS